MATSARSLRGSLWGQPLLSVVQNHLISYPTPSNLSGNWNWGVLAGLCLVLQIATGIFLAMHYTAHVDLAFHSVQHIMRDVSNGWLLRYLHAIGASLFFIVVYMHLFRGLYYTSYAQPRELVWLLGVVILLVMILTAFIGYVLPWGLYLAQNEFITNEDFHSFLRNAFFLPRIPALKRFGPHKKEIYSILTGSLLGDGYAERHGLGTRFHFHYSHRNAEYLFSLHNLFSKNGYSNPKKPKLKKIIGKGGKFYFSLRFRTYSFASFNDIYESWYPVKGLKTLPTNLNKILTPMALAVWVMDDGSFTGYGVKIATDCFTKQEVFCLSEILQLNFGLQTSVQYQNSKWRLYIQKSSMPVLKKQIENYLVPSMRYKLGISSKFNKTYSLF